MSKKPILVYSMASAGMGHATRAIPMLDRLSMEYEVHIFCSGKANIWLGKQYPNLHQNHPIKGVKSNGKINITLVVIKAWMNLPITVYHTLRILLFILMNKPVAVVSDFELHAIMAGRISNLFRKMPVISCDHWTTLIYSECPFEFNNEQQLEYERWKKNINIITSKADHFLVHKSLKTKLSKNNAIYVPAPVRDSFLEAGKSITNNGPIVVSTGHLQDEVLINTLKETPYKFIFFGSPELKVEGNVTFHPFDEEKFIKAIQASPFVMVSANSSAIDSLAINKALLYIPNPGQFEQYFCGKIFEYLGVAYLTENLKSSDIKYLFENIDKYNQRVLKLDLFDNDGLYKILNQYIKGEA